MTISTPEHDVEGVIDHDHDYHTMNTRWDTYSVRFIMYLRWWCFLSSAFNDMITIMYVSEVCSVKINTEHSACC